MEIYISGVDSHAVDYLPPPLRPNPLIQITPLQEGQFLLESLVPVRFSLRATMQKLVALLVALCAVGSQACTSVYFGPHRHLLAAETGAHWNYNSNGADWPGVCESGEEAEWG